MGWADCDQSIPQYLGVRPFHQLPCYPIDYHPEPERIKAVLKARGQVFESFAGFHYKFYNGPASYHPETNPSKTRIETVQSRIVIDGKNWEKSNPENVVWLSNFHEYGIPEESRRGSISSDASGGSGYDSDDGKKGTGAATDSEDSRAPLAEDQLLLCSPIVRGYSLKNKRWMEFFVDNIEEIEFNDQAFDSLVLQEDHKELILAFAQSQVKYKHAFDDIISGKGRGIIMLLSGGPGIGKTLTAESVAEEMRVPLYIMSAGDLGTEAHEVEENLSSILNMVANWNAVLLLDECDVFLEERTAHDMERNRIVGIFLRLLEYYQGCLFLTTNRVKSMDPAFQSRIHLSIEYPPLDEASRVAIWKGFLGRTVSLSKELQGDDAHEVTDDEVTRLSKLDLNGRQIKNVLKMANLLSCQKEEKLKFEHVRKVLKVEGHSL
jgi:AAA+ superfamily predicted ATPase